MPPSGKAVLLYSRQLELLEHWGDSSGRATGGRFRLPSGNEITCVGLHWHTRDSRGGIDDPYERGGAMALFRHHLEDRLPKGSPAVLMGDFNCSAQEHEREMCSPYCLFALSERHRVTPAMEQVMGREKRAWMLVEPAMPRHVGTFYWGKKAQWSVVDHVVLTPDLRSNLIGAEVLTSLEGHKLLTEHKQVPRSPDHASDHLPVVCTIQYE